MTESLEQPGRSSRGLLLVLSGPSGSGKSTLVDRLLDSGEFPITFSVSATSRPPRAGEIDGRHYHFLSRERFLAQRDEGAFLEHAEVHGNLYGTPKQNVESILAAGRWVLLEIDVQGHRQVKEKMPEAVSFFLRTPDVAEYEVRLRGRGTDNETTIARRLAELNQQLRQASTYDFQIVNESIDQALHTFRTLLWGIQTLRGTSE